MIIFNTIPRHIVFDLCFEWLLLVDLAYVDISLNVNGRSQFLGLLKESSAQLNKLKHLGFRATAAMLNWYISHHIPIFWFNVKLPRPNVETVPILLLRELRRLELVASRSELESFSLPLLPSTIKYVEVVCLDAVYGMDLLNFQYFETCSIIFKYRDHIWFRYDFEDRSVEIQYTEDIANVISILPSLKSLKFHAYPKMIEKSTQIIEICTQHSETLESISFLGNGVSVDLTWTLDFPVLRHCFEKNCDAMQVCFEVLQKLDSLTSGCVSYSRASRFLKITDAFLPKQITHAIL